MASEQETKPESPTPDETVPNDDDTSGSSESSSRTKVARIKSTLRYAGLAALFALIAIALLRPPVPPSAESLDSAFRLSYAVFLQGNYKVNSDYIFTYGPFGHFLVPQYQPGLYWLSYAVTLAMALIGSAVLTAFIRYHPNRLLAAIFAVYFVVFVPFFGPETGYLTTAATAAFLVASGKIENPLFTGMLGAAVAFLFLCKFTLAVLGTGFIGYVTLIALLDKRPRLAFLPLASFLVSLPIMWLLGGQSISAIPGYLINSIEISRAYKQGMGLEGSGTALMLGLTTGVMSLCAVLLTLTHPGSAAKRACHLIFALSLIVTTWSMGYVRQNGHETKFIGACLAVAFIFTHFKPAATWRNRMRDSVVIAALILGLATHLVVIHQSPIKSLQSAVTRMQRVAAATIRPAETLEEHRRIRMNLREKVGLPRTRDFVGEATIDMFPPSQDVLLLNDLNYRPRPVIQGYQACTNALLERNGSYYRGDLQTPPPEFVLFSLELLDGRFRAMEDSQALHALLDNYRPVFYEQPFILYKRDSQLAVDAAPIPHKAPRDTANLNQPIHLSAHGDNWLVLTVDIRPSWKGKLRSAVFKLPPLYIRTKTDDGEEETRLIIPSMLHQPFVLSPILTNGLDILGYPASQPALYVTQFTIGTTPEFLPYFNSEFTFSLQSIPVPRGLVNQ